MSDAISEWFRDFSFTDACARFDKEGFIVFENVLDATFQAKLNEALRPHLENGHTGRNDFEGVKTSRVYALLSKDPVFAELVTHPLALAFAEADLGPNCLLSACLAINLMPDETAQPWHFDDSHIAIARPRPSCGVSAFWALDDTTEINGATQVLPGSHLWESDTIEGSASVQSLMQQGADLPSNDNEASDQHQNAVKVCLPRGSVMFTKGTLWHRGGANRSDKSRLIITPQYCVGWARQLENMMLTMSQEQLKALPLRVQELVGVSIYPPFMGYVDGVHPARKLMR